MAASLKCMDCGEVGIRGPALIPPYPLCPWCGGRLALVNEPISWEEAAVLYANLLDSDYICRLEERAFIAPADRAAIETFAQKYDEIAETVDAIGPTAIDEPIPPELEPFYLAADESLVRVSLTRQERHSN